MAGNARERESVRWYRASVLLWLVDNNFDFCSPSQLGYFRFDRMSIRSPKIGFIIIVTIKMPIYISPLNMHKNDHFSENRRVFCFHRYYTPSMHGIASHTYTHTHHTDSSGMSTYGIQLGRTPSSIYKHLKSLDRMAYTRAHPHTSWMNVKLHIKMAHDRVSECVSVLVRSPLELRTHNFLTGAHYTQTHTHTHTLAHTWSDASDMWACIRETK